MKVLATHFYCIIAFVLSRYMVLLNTLKITFLLINLLWVLLDFKGILRRKHFLKKPKYEKLVFSKMN